MKKTFIHKLALLLIGMLLSISILTSLHFHEKSAPLIDSHCQLCLFQTQAHAVAMAIGITLIAPTLLHRHRLSFLRTQRFTIVLSSQPSRGPPVFL